MAENRTVVLFFAIVPEPRKRRSGRAQYAARQRRRVPAGAATIIGGSTRG
jgi:hypothetical protein